MNRNREITLHKAGCGKQVVVTRLDAENESRQRLAEMGFRENATITKIVHGAALICAVCGVRVAISEQLAESIFVREVVWNWGLGGN